MKKGMHKKCLGIITIFPDIVKKRGPQTHVGAFFYKPLIFFEVYPDDLVVFSGAPKHYHICLNPHPKKRKHTFQFCSAAY